MAWLCLLMSVKSSVNVCQRLLAGEIDFFWVLCYCVRGMAITFHGCGSDRSWAWQLNLTFG